jgi:transcriptional regulator with XRE-family HTH domain
MSILANNLKFLRNKKGLNQQEIADMFNLKTYTTVSKWESGMNEPSVYCVKILAKFYGYEMNQLIDIDLEKEMVMPSIHKKTKKFEVEIGDFVVDLEEEITDLNISYEILKSKGVYFFGVDAVDKMNPKELLQYANEVRIILLEIKKM